MARGSESKASVFKKLMEVYPESFWEDEDKILRIPVTENGDVIEIKVTLTAAKNNLGGGAAASAFVAPGQEEVSSFMPAPEPSVEVEVTEEEKERVAQLLASLGL